MPKRAVFERSQELSLDVSVYVHILLVVEQSSLESQSREPAKTPILTDIFHKTGMQVTKCVKIINCLVNVHLGILYRM